MGFRGTLQVLFSAIVFLGMIGLAIYWRDHGGYVGLAIGALGFLLRYFELGQHSGEERLGNGYVGALMGLSLGFLAGAVGVYAVQHWPEWYAAALQQAGRT